MAQIALDQVDKIYPNGVHAVRGVAAGAFEFPE